MRRLLLWYPYRSFMPTPVPLLHRMVASGELEELVPGKELLSAQLNRIASAGLLFVDQSFFNALNGGSFSNNWVPEHRTERQVLIDLMGAVMRSSALRVLGLTWNDLHWLNIPGNPSFCAQDLAGFAPQFHGLVWGYEHWGEVASGRLPTLHESWMKSCGSMQENWHTLADSIPSRFDCPFALSDCEIRRSSAIPVWDASVIGARYSSRVLANDSAIREKLCLAPVRALTRNTERALLLRRWLLPKQDAWDLSAKRILMDALVARSRVNFVCGGGPRYFVRKYFEFAGVGACMASWPATGQRHYGLRDGEHLAECSEPSEFGTVAKWLLARSGLRERMGAAARRLVHERHTVESRAAQLREWLNHLARGASASGVWHEGEFRITSDR